MYKDTSTITGVHIGGIKFKWVENSDLLMWKWKVVVEIADFGSSKRDFWEWWMKLSFCLDEFPVLDEFAALLDEFSVDDFPVLDAVVIQRVTYPHNPPVKSLAVSANAKPTEQKRQLTVMADRK